MDSNSVEIQKRDSYWANNPRTRFGRTLYKVCVQRQRQSEGTVGDSKTGLGSCKETSEVE